MTTDPADRPRGAGKGDRIRLRDLRVFGYHGALKHEREHGQIFVIDLDVVMDLSMAGTSDRLEDTVDYGELASAVAGVVGGTPWRLIEAVAEQVADRTLDIHPRVEEVWVRVTKPHAPIEQDAEVSVELTRTRAGRGLPS